MGTAFTGSHAATSPNDEQRSTSIEDLRQSGLRDPDQLARRARLFVLLSLGMSLIAMISTVMEMQFFRAMEAGQYGYGAELTAAAESNDLRQSIIGFTQVAVYTLAVIFVARWIYFSSKNVRLLGARHLTIRPGWAVGWYFVPIANLWKPYQAMKEIWQASADPLDWQRQGRSSLLPIWWALWLITGFIEQGATRLVLRAETVDDWMRFDMIVIAAETLHIVLSVVFVMLIAEIARLQTNAIRNRNYLEVF